MVFLMSFSICQCIQKENIPYLIKILPYEKFIFKHEENKIFGRNHRYHMLVLTQNILK